MFFLLRVAFWLTLVFLLLPGLSGTSGDGRSVEGEHAASNPAAPKVGAFEALGAASSAVADAGGFCTRQPQACAIGSNIIDMLGERAQAGAQLVLGYITEQIVEQKRRVAERAAGSSAADTLNAHDLSPAWQGARPGSPAPEAPARASEAEPAAAAKGAPGAPPVPLPPKKPA
ncbi:DUF5330 domain-containing protein [Ancylobacter sp. A5.8]|uniref:DUF5330 domain-containing protein n=1 Tax=Ancylobacter gelatini TaxID=2919920 RepID=UPI001F4D59CF|nr:DUF5330 domain-containing protein [Ancylobacter gelatini]MCJ8143849.1 DUF5330 domain-containing protein [Ancylobacter gelatini]